MSKLYLVQVDMEGDFLAPDVVPAEALAWLVEHQVAVVVWTEHRRERLRPLRLRPQFAHPSSYEMEYGLEWEGGGEETNEYALMFGFERQADATAFRLQLD